MNTYWSSTTYWGLFFKDHSSYHSVAFESLCLYLSKLLCTAGIILKSASQILNHLPVILSRNLKRIVLLSFIKFTFGLGVLKLQDFLDLELWKRFSFWGNYALEEPEKLVSLANASNNLLNLKICLVSCAFLMFNLKRVVIDIKGM